MAASRGMKVAAVTGVLALATLVGILVLGRRNAGGGMADDFAVTDLNGQAVRLSGYRGQVVLLNLWATWCPPCREEMPSMERLWQRFRGKGFVLLAVSQDEEGATAVAPFVKNHQLTFPVLVDPDHQVGDRYGVWGYPESFLIDREGHVVERVIGPRDWSSPQQIAAIERLLATPTGGVAATGTAE
jgi:cytochrome c biogenesis protein CcmG/thiol:disulfide interchange protein DsbE